MRYLVLEVILDADAGRPASVALGVIDANGIRLLLDHISSRVRASAEEAKAGEHSRARGAA